MKFADRRTAGAVAGLAAASLIVAGCSNADTTPVAATTSVSTSSAAAAAATSHTAASGASRSAGSSAASVTSASRSSAAAAAGAVKAPGTDGSEVTLKGPIGVRYAAATPAEKKILGPVLMGDHNAGTRDSGVIFQQFKGGVITARNATAGTPAYITYGQIRDAWNVERDPSGKPVTVGGTNGSAGPLGAVTSDVTTNGAVQQTTFEHGKVTYNTQTQKVEVTVNGKVVPSGL